MRINIIYYKLDDEVCDMLTAEDMLRIGEGVADLDVATAKEVHVDHKVVPRQVFDEDESFDVPEAYISPDLKSMIDVAQTEINKIKAIGMTQYLKTKSDAKTKSVIKI
ncbi:hypothetical protein SAMN02910357_01562 [Succinivibrio dextrinosolvens]|nr:hypothetical protein SAMN02910357_01562 [Succinivibrio dextrinosolvens]